MKYQKRIKQNKLREVNMTYSGKCCCVGNEWCITAMKLLFYMIKRIISTNDVKQPGNYYFARLKE